MPSSTTSSSTARTTLKGPNKCIKGYLFAYNFAQVLGRRSRWSYLLFLIIKYYAVQQKEITLWDMAKPIVVIFQNAAVLEILHAAFGLVSSNVMITLMQVFSRVMVVCGVLLATPTAPISYGLPLLLFAWSITEIIRYLYYSLNILGEVPYALIWCRYTFFYALYPIGVTGELLCFYAAQSYVKQANLWSTEMPNSWNFAFSYQYLLILIMLSYIPLFPQMYLHMINQRKKIIGRSAKKAS